jgi:hypothetical protein
MKLDGERFFKRSMVVLLTLRAECSLVTLKPAHLSPYLPLKWERLWSLIDEAIAMCYIYSNETV